MLATSPASTGDVADFFQASPERGQKVWIIAGRPAVEALRELDV
jgi:hypothetical protein